MLNTATKRDEKREDHLVALGRRHAQASVEETDARRNIAADRAAGRQPAKGDVDKKGKAITDKADIKEAQKQAQKK